VHRLVDAPLETGVEFRLRVEGRRRHPCTDAAARLVVAVTPRSTSGRSGAFFDLRALATTSVLPEISPEPYSSRVATASTRRPCGYGGCSGSTSRGRFERLAPPSPPWTARRPSAALEG
jgi:hypothetical protein